MSAPAMYVSREPAGLFGLRHEDNRGRYVPGDLVATARSVEKLRQDCARFYPGTAWIEPPPIPRLIPRIEETTR